MSEVDDSPLAERMSEVDHYEIGTGSPDGSEPPVAVGVRVTLEDQSASVGQAEDSGEATEAHPQ